jgi:membrane-bound lytic murein transglycosylase A
MATAITTAISRKTQSIPELYSRAMKHRIVLLALIALAVAGCVTPPAPTAAKPPETLICPPAEKPVCPAVTPPPVPELEPKGRLVAARWADIPDWGRHAMRDSLAAFSRGCATLENQDPWKGACAGAATLANAAEPELVSFFELNFDPWQALNADDSTTGMVTGYYEPLLHGSLKRTARYKYPLYSVPQDMLTIDLASVYPDLKGRRLRGRVQGNKVVPYLDRGEIDREAGPLGGLELAWVDDAIDVFFLHIQGSGQVELENGERIRVGYADQNGHPFKSLGRLLIQRGELPAERASMQGIKDWARRNPAKVQEYLNANPSYVFFRELPKDLSGPIGSLGVPLTPERSIAVDTRVIPLGAPVFLATTFPNSPQPLNRLMVAQDTGGAINGGVRADFFWGFGDAAGAQAGKMRQGGRMWVLYPKGATPPAANNNPMPATRTP